MSSESLIYGYHPVRELLRSRPQSVLQVMAAQGRGGQRRREIEDLCRRHHVEFKLVNEGRLRALCGEVTHNGFLARTAPVAEPGVGGGDPELIVLLEDIQDPRNLGALLRVFEGAGVGKVLLRDRGSAPITPTVNKVSAGASEWLAMERITNSAQEIRRLQSEGFWVHGADAAGSPPWEVDLSGRVLLCLGGEERGLRAKTRKLCDGLLGLPMLGQVESLNVATAASALLYEALRQRAAKDGKQGG